MKVQQRRAVFKLDEDEEMVSHDQPPYTSLSSISYFYPEVLTTILGSLRVNLNERLIRRHCDDNLNDAGSGRHTLLVLDAIFQYYYENNIPIFLDDQENIQWRLDYYLNNLN